MSVTEAQLLSRKEDLLDALRTLEDDRQAGAIDERAYQSARVRYENEAAGILEQLDGLAPTGQASRPPVTSARPGRLLPLLAAGGVIAAIVLLLVSALRARGTGETITGAQPTIPVSGVMSPAVRKAEQVVSHHMHSASAWTALGQAQLDAGNTADGMAALREAIHLDPHQAQALTLLAISLASGGHEANALGYLTRAERAQPGYARAWLADGMIAARQRATLSRAIAAWKRFLVLQPHATVSPQVRSWLRAAEKAAQR